MNHASPAFLRILREHLSVLLIARERGFCTREIVRLANDVGGTMRIAIDLEASEELGSPLVVVWPPESKRIDPRFAALSEREHEVASLIADGLGNKEIAARLRISVLTVKDHVHHIFAKSGLQGRAAVILSYRANEPASIS
jgi:DNA-binding NarL/FixJ family response regulator